MAVPYILTLPALFAATESMSLPTMTVTGLSSLPVAIAAGTGMWGYNRYNKDINRLNEQAHYSDRNANRLIYNIGQSRPSQNTPTHFPSGHIGSPSNPILLKEVVIRAPFSNTYNSVLGIDQPTDSTTHVNPTDSTAVRQNSTDSTTTTRVNPPNNNNLDNDSNKTRILRVREKVKNTYSKIPKGLKKTFYWGTGLLAVGSTIATIHDVNTNKKVQEVIPNAKPEYPTFESTLILPNMIKAGWSLFDNAALQSANDRIARLKGETILQSNEQVSQQIEEQPQKPDSVPVKQDSVKRQSIKDQMQLFKSRYE